MRIIIPDSLVFINCHIPQDWRFTDTFDQSDCPQLPEAVTVTMHVSRNQEIYMKKYLFNVLIFSIVIAGGY